MNYALVDPHGRLYFGTLDNKEFCGGPANKGFYVYDSNQKPSKCSRRCTKSKKLKKLISDIQISTGIAINKDEKKLYHGNACNCEINEYDWNPKTGCIRKNIIYESLVRNILKL